MDWSKFDKKVDIKGLQKDIEEAGQNSGEFTGVPNGTYEVKIDKLELGVTKETNKPKLVVWFKILNGEFKNSILFMNSVISEGWQIKNAISFLKSLETDTDVEFDGYAKLEQDLMNISEFIENCKLEYAVEYGENKSGYKTFKIVEVYEG